MGVGRAVHETDLVSAGRDVFGVGVVIGDEIGQLKGTDCFPAGLLLIVRAAGFMPVMRAYG
jgi:hypothetical protein